MSLRVDRPFEDAVLIALFLCFFFAGVSCERERHAAPAVRIIDSFNHLPTPPAEAGEENQSRVDDRSASSARRGSIPYLPAGSACDGAAFPPLRESNTGARIAPHAAAREQI